MHLREMLNALQLPVIFFFFLWLCQQWITWLNVNTEKNDLYKQLHIKNFLLPFETKWYPKIMVIELYKFLIKHRLKLYFVIHFSRNYLCFMENCFCLSDFNVTSYPTSIRNKQFECSNETLYELLAWVHTDRF